MKRQVFNPYLPCYEYIPDGEPHVFGDRVYIYGSHDRFNGEKFCMNDYVCWSAPVNDLSDWRYEGVIYRKTQEITNTDGARNLFAPDAAQGPDGRYYLYYSMMGTVSVAVCDAPAGAYEFYSHVEHPDGTPLGRQKGDNVNFDPAIFVEDGKVYLYSGVVSDPEIRAMIKRGGLLADGAYCIELEPDMKTVKAPPMLVVPAEGEDYTGHVFFEASSLRKIRDIYYFVYSSRNGHELCYATCDKPNGRFVYGGTLISNGDVFLNGRAKEDALNYTGNTHGGLLEIDGHVYIFYHRQTNLHHFSRQGCAEEVEMLDDGRILQAEMTSCGLNGGPLKGVGEYETRIACNLLSKNGAVFYPDQGPKMEAGAHPYFTQDKPDGDTEAAQYIANFCDGAMAGFKYFEMDGANSFAVKLRGSATGRMLVSAGLEAAPCGEIAVSPSAEYQWFVGKLDAPKGKNALYFWFEGDGAADFAAFRLKV